MTYEPPLYPTSIPTEADLEKLFDDIDDFMARHHNNPNAELRATQIELGLLPKGTYETVRARLDDFESRIIALEG